MLFGKLLVEPQYFPCLEYFQVLLNSGEILFEVCQNFQKQNYSNRCRILSANGPLDLTIPLHKSSKLQYKEIRIDHSQKWASNHETAIRSAYGKAPFFEHYIAPVIEMLRKKHQYLLDTNLHIMSNCLELMNRELKFALTDHYEKQPSKEITDLRSMIHPKKNSTLQNLLPSISYTQVFGREFVKNLCIVDLLFCEGPQAGYILTGKED